LTYHRGDFDAGLKKPSDVCGRMIPPFVFGVWRLAVYRYAFVKVIRNSRFPDAVISRSITFRSTEKYYPAQHRDELRENPNPVLVFRKVILLRSPFRITFSKSWYFGIVPAARASDTNSPFQSDNGVDDLNMLAAATMQVFISVIKADSTKAQRNSAFDDTLTCLLPSILDIQAWDESGFICQFSKTLWWFPVIRSNREWFQRKRNKMPRLVIPVHGYFRLFLTSKRGTKMVSFSYRIGVLP
jgi:hypothetical protein